MSAFFSGAEVGFISLDLIILKLKTKKDRVIKDIIRFIENPEKIIYVSLVGTNISIIAATQILSRYINSKMEYGYIFMLIIYRFSALLQKHLP